MAESPGRALPTLLAVANTSYTVLTAGGAGTWVLLRTLLIANELDAPIRVTVGLGTSNTDAAGKRIGRQFTLLPNEFVDVLDDVGFLVLLGHATTPDLVYAVGDQANCASVTPAYVSGP